MSETLSQIKKKRLTSVLETILDHRVITRFELGNLLELSSSAIINYSKELISVGLIREQGHADSSGGRKPVYLELNPDYLRCIAVVVDVTTIRGAIMDSLGGIIGEVTCPAPAVLRRSDLLAALYEVIDSLLAHPEIGDQALLGIGVGIGGLVDADGGIVSRYYFSSDWFEVPLRDLIEEKYNLPCVIENKAKAVALGDKYFGLGRGAVNFLSLWLGQGVGMGIVINGEIYPGAGNFSGEIGHTLAVEEGKQCFCGHRGCLETVTNENFIVEQAKDSLREGVQSEIFRLADGDIEMVTIGQIIEAASNNDILARTIFRSVAEHLGRKLVDVVNILDPDLIILEGPVSYDNTYLADEIARYINENALVSVSKRIATTSVKEDRNKRLEGILAKILLGHFVRMPHQR